MIWRWGYFHYCQMNKNYFLYFSIILVTFLFFYRLTIKINKQNMTTTININGKDVEITLTKEQIEAINKKSQKVTDRIKTFEDVLEDQNITMDYFLSGCKGLTLDEIAYKKIKLIAKSLNEGWTPNWSDSNEYKYTPYFKMNGCAFSYSYYCLWYAIANVGSRLCLKSKELALELPKIFVVEFENYFLIKK